MSPAEVVARLRANGHTVTLNEAGRPWITPPIPPELAAQLRPHAERIAALLTAEATCTGCGLPARRLVVSYWDDAARYCPECCATLAARFDQSDTWPACFWADKDALT